MATSPKRPLIGIALIVRKKNKVLLHKRKSNHAKGKWGFAGGHLEKWENLEECAIRELEEEAGTDIKVTRPKFWTLSNVFYKNEDKHYVTLFFVSDWLEGKPQITEPTKCAGWEWFDWNDGGDGLPSPLMDGIQNLVNKSLYPTEVKYSELIPIA